MFGRIDHVGVAVESLEDSLALYRDVFRLEPVHREVVSEQGVEAVLFDVGESHVELIAPLSAESGVARFLDRNGPGLHHVAYQVSDIEPVLDALRAAGMRLIDEHPRTGIRGSRVAFLHPRSTGGVLTEIVEPAHGHAAPAGGTHAAGADAHAAGADGQAASADAHAAGADAQAAGAAVVGAEAPR